MCRPGVVSSLASFSKKVYTARLSEPSMLGLPLVMISWGISVLLHSSCLPHCGADRRRLGRHDPPAELFQTAALILLQVAVVHGHSLLQPGKPQRDAVAYFLTKHGSGQGGVERQ